MTNLRFPGVVRGAASVGVAVAGMVALVLGGIGGVRVASADTPTVTPTTTPATATPTRTATTVPTATTTPATATPTVTGTVTPPTSTATLTPTATTQASLGGAVVPLFVPDRSTPVPPPPVVPQQPVTPPVIVTAPNTGDGGLADEQGPSWLLGAVVLGAGALVFASLRLKVRRG